MNTYLIDSIDYKYCLKTNPDTLYEIKVCQSCLRIPLPCYRSNKDPPEFIFCRTCYYSKNKMKEHLKNPSNDDLKLLYKLVINCANYEKGCQEKFSINTLDKLLLHYDNCPKANNISFKKCKRCSMVLHKTMIHDCFNQIKNNDTVEHLNKANQELREEIKHLKETLYKQELSSKSQTAEINHIKKIIQSKFNEIDNKIEKLFLSDINLENSIKSQKSIIASLSQIVSSNQSENQDFKKNIVIPNYNVEKPHIKDIYNINQSFQEYQQENPISYFKKSISNKDELNIFNNISQKNKQIETDGIDFHLNSWTLIGHLRDVKSLIQLNDGKIASCSNDKTIKFWDLNTYECTLSLSGHEDSVFSVIQLNDGRIASCSKDCTIKIWEFRSNKRTTNLTLKGHSSHVNTIIQLNDGRIASCSKDKSLKFWDLSTNQCTGTIAAHSKDVLSLIQLRDGRIASCSEDKKIKIWDLNTLKCIITLSGHYSFVMSLIQLKDGRIASCSDDKTIKVWDLKTSECSFTLIGHESYIIALIQLNDQKIGSCSFDKSIKFWDLNSMKCTFTLTIHEDNVHSLIQLKDGRIASCSSDKTIKLWRY